jgi:hypothetical protein
MSGSMSLTESLLGRFRLTLLAQPKTLQQCRHGVAEAAILQLGIGQHRGARPALAAHLDSFALGALARGRVAMDRRATLVVLEACGLIHGEPTGRALALFQAVR